MNSDCAVSYESPNPNSRYCGHSCAAKVSNTSRKKPSVTKECVVCGANFELPFKARKGRETCSLKCKTELRAQKIDFEEMGRSISRSRREGIASGRIVVAGHPHTEETKRHLSEVSSGGRRAGENNGMYGRRHSDDARQRMSETRTARIVAGVYDPGKWSKRGEVYAAKADRVIPYRSSWELRAIEMLEADPEVVSFEFEPIRIPYYYGFRNDGSLQRRYYIPDFLVLYRDGRRVLVEVKPVCHVTAAVNVAKFSAAHEYCLSEGISAHEVWTQERLFPED